MNYRIVGLMVFALTTSSFAGDTTPQPPVEGGGEAHECFVDSGTSNCPISFTFGCEQNTECSGEQWQFTGASSNVLVPAPVAGYLGDFVFQEVCFHRAPCIELALGGCGPDIANVTPATFMSGHVNWDMPCFREW